jgi:hypothetical protein
MAIDPKYLSRAWESSRHGSVSDALAWLQAKHDDYAGMDIPLGLLCVSRYPAGTGNVFVATIGYEQQDDEEAAWRPAPSS